MWDIGTREREENKCSKKFKEKLKSNIEMAGSALYLCKKTRESVRGKKKREIVDFLLSVINEHSLWIANFIVIC